MIFEKMTQTDWNQRLRRAEDLLERSSPRLEVLAFYAQILRLQQQMGESLASQSTSMPSLDGPLRVQLDVEFAFRWLPGLLDVVQKHGPAKLAQEAARIGTSADSDQRRLLVDSLRQEHTASYAPQSFFARVLFQPCAAFLASRRPPMGASGVSCPMCGSLPQLAVLRPEGDGGKRHLACSLCLTEWEFRRIICPICQEVDPYKLPRYTAEDPIAVRVEACDTCKAYLKSFDMTIDGLLVPEVDEIATVHLDVWAAEAGYHKIQLNLLGF